MIIKTISYPLNDKFPESVIGLGYFDGVHLGHQNLIKKVLEIAKNNHNLSSILTFSSSIDKVLGKNFDGELTPLSHRLKLFEEFGIDVCYIFDFNEDTMKLSKDDFINMLKQLNIKNCVCGQDFRFGFKGSGTVNDLKENFNVNVVNFVIDKYSDQLKVSSSSIIQYLKEGKIKEANECLGHKYSIIGKVVRGLGNGQKIGFPTANIDYSDYILPLNGVYAVKVLIENEYYKGVCNIGLHPTIDKLEIPALEVYILDYSESIYNRICEIVFIDRIRDEQKFENVENLKNSIKLDTFFDF